MTLRNKTYEGKAVCSNCKSELARHHELADIEYSGNFATTSSM
jgi:hypothetical protein